MVDLASKTHLLRCKVCSLIESKDKILNPMFDGLYKHAGKRKALIFHPRVLIDESYINNDSRH